MRLVDASSAESYLRENTCLAPGERVNVRELTGGVSNMVLLVERPQRRASEFVLKQARAQLRTSHEWFSSVERIWREAEVLTLCGRLLERAERQRRARREERPPLSYETPHVLFEDRPNYLFAMTAARSPHAVWKNELLAGRLNPEIATACGQLLGTLHAGSWGDAAIAARLGDQTLFDELRIDPYYRTLAERRSDALAGIERLIASLAAPGRSLVLADFSPKNLLVHADGLVLVDFETGHYGEPAFDLGFFLSHLVLKAFCKAPGHAPYLELTERFRAAYDGVMTTAIDGEELAALWARGIQHFAGCGWARLDGKSPVEYLSEEARKQSLRGLFHGLFERPVAAWPEVLAAANARLADLS